MVTKTTTRPSPRSSSSHSHSYSQSQRIFSKPSSTTTTAAIMSPTAARVPVAVGQPAPPTSSALRSPGAQGAQGEQVRPPSPNYFGLKVDPASNPRDSNMLPKENWSPTTSSIFSFGVASPERLPIDANPDFEAFKKQSESNHKFNLGHGGLASFSMSPGPSHLRSKNDKNPSTSLDNPPSPKSVSKTQHMYHRPRKLQVPQCTPLLSSISPGRCPLRALGLACHQFRGTFSHVLTTDIQDSLSRKIKSTPLLREPKLSRKVLISLPLAFDDAPAMITPAQLKEMMDRLPSSQFLLLDCRASNYFSDSRVLGALNLCIPTTLLKRPSFTLQKLQDTFTNDDEKKKFSKWRSTKYIIAYDATSSEKKDAVVVINTLKKFTNEGWNGSRHILKGGFEAFAALFPQSIDRATAQTNQSSRINLTLGTKLSDVAPVAGGCAMPKTKNALNPFFSNIRQNQDLIDGVGQMDVKVPEDFVHDKAAMKIVPRWLKKAAQKEDHGKLVSDKFLTIEVAEQKRMTKALTSGVTYGTPAPGSTDVQIAGVEKGGKNRYNNIWPFEHTRVRLQGKADGACDYVNASHVKASRSNKHYIASQGPMPATFEDFWSVIWEQDVRVIVMLTAESEGGQLKCHSYWSSNDYGHLKLKALSEKKVSLDPTRRRNSTDRRDSNRRRAITSVENATPSPSAEAPYAIVRKFTLSHAAHPFTPMREITQIHYSSWPDFGAPAEPSELLALVQLSNLMQRAASSVTQSPRLDDPEEEEETRPMLVHCSAGCGRTGTFCTVDSVIDMLKRQRKEVKSGVTPMEFTSSSNGDYMAHKEPKMDWIFDQDLDLIEKTVEDFRGQRLSMVQSLKQYVLCYETVLEWISQQHSGNSGIKGYRDRSGSVGEVIA
ncbi:tyrosine phosphatase protein [Rutstroemia sp. NJR-2017a BBW]|nr:tyrosine phosphatase protein [Rutstroemia sp. NJR-2017a BBW]